MEERQVEVRSPLQGTVVRIERGVGQDVDASTPVVVVESMKMEHVVRPGTAGSVSEVRVQVGDAVLPGDVVALVDPAPVRPDGR
jgi:biotin carboxyl carrier protein